MNNCKKITTVILTIVLIVLTMSIVYSVYGVRPNYVYDRANVLDVDEEANLNDLCLGIDNRTTTEVVIITLHNLDVYGGDAFDAVKTIWTKEPLDGVVGVGKADKDNGVMILVAIDDREWFIGTGKGIEGTITDGEAGRIGRGELVPEFKQEDYYQGLYNTVIALGEEIESDDTEYSDLTPEEQEALDKQREEQIEFVLSGVLYATGFTLIAGGTYIGAKVINKWNGERKRNNQIRKKLKLTTKKQLKIFDDFLTKSEALVIDIKTFPDWARRVAIKELETNNTPNLKIANTKLDSLQQNKYKTKDFETISNELTIVEVALRNVKNALYKIDVELRGEIGNYETNLPNQIKKTKSTVEDVATYITQQIAKGYKLTNTELYVENLQNDVKSLLTQHKNATKNDYKDLFETTNNIIDSANSIRKITGDHIATKEAVDEQLKLLPKQIERIAKGVPKAQETLNIIKTKHSRKNWTVEEKGLDKIPALLKSATTDLKTATKLADMKNQKFKEGAFNVDRAKKTVQEANDRLDAVFNLNEELHRLKNQLPSQLITTEDKYEKARRMVSHSDVSTTAKQLVKQSHEKLLTAKKMYVKYTDGMVFDWVLLMALIVSAKTLAGNAIATAEMDKQEAEDRRRRERRQREEERQRRYYSSSSSGSSSGSSGGFGGGGFGGGGAGGGW